jgi:hypothetical protein
VTHAPVLCVGLLKLLSASWCATFNDRIGLRQFYPAPGAATFVLRRVRFFLQPLDQAGRIWPGAPPLSFDAWGSFFSQQN